MIAASPGDRFGSTRQAERISQVRARSAPHLHPGADGASGTPDLARAEGRTGGAWRQGLAQCGLAISTAQGIAVQKMFAIEQGRADVATRRRRWQSWQHGLDPRRLVFIDDTWIKTNMTPLRGWAPKGKRLRSFAQYCHWRTLTFLGALRPAGSTLPFRWTNKRRLLPGPCRTATRAHPEARRHRHHG